MSAADLNVAVWRYDRTQALYDGRVGIPGRVLRMIDAPLEDIFSKAFTTADYEVTELSLSNYLRMRVDGDCAYQGVPTFPSRSFRHGSFYVLRNGSVRKPEDLIGRRVGVREYSMTAALAARGALRDQFGIGAHQIDWIMGDVDHHERDTIVPPRLFRDDISIEVAPKGAYLNDMLLDGRVDAILAYKPIPSSMGPAAKACRMFEDTEAVEKSYYKEFGIFPIMHLIGVRKDEMHRDRKLSRAVFDAFVAAQNLANEDLAYEQALKIGLPWLRQELARTTDTMGRDFWPNGFEANRVVLGRMIQWSFEDGLICRIPAPEELFDPALIST